MFSVDDRAIVIYGKDDYTNNEAVILWRPYHDDADEDTGTFVTLWICDHIYINEVIASRDNTMIAMKDIYRNTGRLLSIDKNTYYQKQTLTFPRNVEVQSLLYFTPDNKCILCSTLNNELKYWSVAESKFTEREHFFYNGNDTNSLLVDYVSRNNRYCIVWDTSINYGRYIISFF